MTRVAFVVLGRPRGKGRPRFNPSGGPPITPKATVEAERTIGQEYRIAARSTPLMTGTVTLSLEAIFRVPRSWPLRLRQAALSGQVEYTGRPDRDNLAKLYMDALNSVAWVDDAQVNRGPIIRRYGDAERVEVVVEEVKAEASVKSPAERRREQKLAAGTAIPAKRKRRVSRGCKVLAMPEIGRRIR